MKYARCTAIHIHKHSTSNKYQAVRSTAIHIHKHSTSNKYQAVRSTAIHIHKHSTSNKYQAVRSTAIHIHKHSTNNKYQADTLKCQELSWLHGPEICIQPRNKELFSKPRVFNTNINQNFDYGGDEIQNYEQNSVLGVKYKFIKWDFARAQRNVLNYNTSSIGNHLRSTSMHRARLLDRKRVNLVYKRPRVQSPCPAHSFVETWSWKHFYGHSPSSADSRRAVNCQLLAKECALSTGKLPRMLALEECG